MVDRGKKAENGAAARLRQRFPTIEDLRARARRRVPRFGVRFRRWRRQRRRMRASQCMRRSADRTASALLHRQKACRPKWNCSAAATRPPSVSRRWDRQARCGRERNNTSRVRRSGATFLTCSRRPPMPRSSRSRRSRRTCSGSSSTGFAFDDHAITFDLVRRADVAGAHVLVPTIDSAGKSKRPRDIRSGVKVPFSPLRRPSSRWRPRRSGPWSFCATACRRSENLVPYAEKATGTRLAGKVIAAARRRQPHLGRTRPPA